MDNIGSLEDQYEDNLLVQNHEQRKKWVKENCGFWQKLAATPRRMVHHTVPALQRGCIHMGPNKVSAARKAPKTSKLINT